MVNKATGQLVISIMSAWGLSLTINGSVNKVRARKSTFYKIVAFWSYDQNVPILWNLWEWTGECVKLF